MSQFTEPLRIFDESPVRSKRPMSKAWPGMAIFGLCFVGSLAGWFVSKTDDARATFGVFSFLFFFPAVGIYFKAWKQAYDITSFYNRFSGQIVFSIFTDKPDADKFREFTSEFIKRVKLTHIQQVENGNDSVAAQITGVGWSGWPLC